MEAPAYIKTALRHYDPGLRVRFSAEKKVWIIERQCPRRLILSEFGGPVQYYTDQDGRCRERLLPENSDLHIQYRDGYVTICEAEFLGIGIIAELWANDSRRFGKHFVKTMAEKWDAAEAKKKRKHLEALEDAGGEMYETMRWRSGSRSSGARAAV